MSIRIKLKPLVEQDLVNIWRYTYENWGERQAEQYLDELDSAILNLAEQPYICRDRLEFSPPVRILHIAHHIVIYQVNDNELLIIRVLHESMKVDAWLDDLE